MNWDKITFYLNFFLNISFNLIFLMFLRNTRVMMHLLVYMYAFARIQKMPLIMYDTSNSNFTNLFSFQSEHVFEPLHRSFWYPSKVVLEIHIVEPKAHSVSQVPLPIVKQWPHKVTPHIATILPALSPCYLIIKIVT